MTNFFLEKIPDFYGVGEAQPKLVVPKVVLHSETTCSADESEQEVEEVV